MSRSGGNHYASRDADLAKAAAEASLDAHAQTTGYAVGAAVLAVSDEKPDGEIVVGSNVEFTSIIAIHAEVIAICNALRRHLKPASIAVATREGIYPLCGACRQIAAIANIDMRVIACDLEGSVKLVSNIRELYPYAFVSAPGE